jgi:hypothetical protein
MLHDNPEIVVRMMRALSQRLRGMEEELDRLSSERPGARTLAAVSSPVAPHRRHVPGEHRLLTRDGKVEFRLSAGSETTIGRRDPVTGIDPDIDLSPIDTNRLISRTHAKIYHRGSKFFVREEIGTSNGTFLNETRLETGVPAVLNDGDRLAFGLVKLTFKIGE